MYAPGVGFQGHCLVVCDACGRAAQFDGIAHGEQLPSPWTATCLPGWAGDFHVCSAECAADLMLQRAGCSEVSVSGASGRDDDTEPGEG